MKSKIAKIIRENVRAINGHLDNTDPTSKLIEDLFNQQLSELKAENESLVEDLKMKDAIIAEFEEVQHSERKQISNLQSELSSETAKKERLKEVGAKEIKRLSNACDSFQSELSAAKERVKELEELLLDLYYTVDLKAQAANVRSAISHKF